MWHDVSLPGVGKWVKTNEAGRIVGRIHFKEGEYRASRLAFDEQGIGNKVYLGAFISLDLAKRAIDNVPPVEVRPLE